MSWLAPANEPFHAESVNKAEFQYKQSERQQPIRPKDEIQRTGGAFGGESSSREAYKVWEPQARHRHQQAAYQKPEGTMDMSTSYAHQFVNGKAYVRLPPIRPESQHRQQQQQQLEFNPSTEQTDSFPSYRRAQLSEAKQPSCRPDRQYRPPEAPFAARTSYLGDFAAAGAVPTEKAKPVRHEDQLRLSTEPMESRSGSTSSGYGVGGETVARRQPIVPRGELTVATGPFAAGTTQREDFASHLGQQPAKREPIRPAGELHLSSPGSELFAARTVAQEDFAARSGGGRPAPVKPRGELELSREPMEAVTTTRDVYTPKARDEPPPTRLRHRQQQTAEQVAG